MSRWLSLAVLLGIIAVVGFAFYRVMVGFLLPLFVAAILVILFRPVHNRCLQRWKGRERLAAILTTAAVLVTVILPMILIMTLAAIEASSLSSHLNQRGLREKLAGLHKKLDLEYEFAEEVRYLESSLDSLKDDARNGATAHGEPVAYRRLMEAVQQLHEQMVAKQRPLNSLDKVEEQLTALAKLGEDLHELGTLRYQQQLGLAADAVRSFKVQMLGGEFRAWVKELANPSHDEIMESTGKFFAGAPGFLRSVGGATTGFIAKLVLQSAILVLSMYFFLTDGPAMVQSFMRLSPLDDAYERELIAEFNQISRAVVLATLLSAVVQGLLAGLGFWFAGVHAVFLLTMLTIVFALIPFVGAATVWLPACLWLYFYEGRLWAAILLGIYGALIVSSSDNVIKPLVLHGQSNLHPLLALLSVLGGVQALGPVGILVGPMVVVFLQTLLNILHRELTTLDRKTAT